MKKAIIFLFAAMTMAQNVNALIVSVSGQGEISEEGKEMTITETEEDPLTGEKRMDLNGNLFAQSTLTVTITRSAEGLIDEFCCGDKCTSGNKTKNEELQFNVNGQADWYVHYTPADGTNTTISYVFSDGKDNLTLRVHYMNGVESVEIIRSEASQSAVYTLTGAQTGIDNMKQAPAGIYIQGGKKIVKTTY